MLEFEWDPDKSASNASKHRVEFREAATVFGDPLSLTVYDPIIRRTKIDTLQWEHRPKSACC